MRDEYQSVKSELTRTLKVEGSRFIAGVFPVENRTHADHCLAGVRRKYHDATHHCFAYAFGSEREDVRFSDDGEPSGSAGIKILSAIQSKDFSDLLVVVTRYFGGTKLGVGGLGRAYFDAATSTLSEAVVVKKIIAEELQITFPYEDTGGVMTLITRSQAKISDTIYDDDVTLRILVRRGMALGLLGDLNNVTRGNLASKVLSTGPQTG
jgi:uncharacterized YigZ family protein